MRKEAPIKSMFLPADGNWLRMITKRFGKYSRVIGNSRSDSSFSDCVLYVFPAQTAFFTASHIYGFGIMSQSIAHEL